MSTQVPRNDKVSVLQKIIQECIQKAKVGKGSPQVKLASQRLFEMASDNTGGMFPVQHMDGSVPLGIPELMQDK